MRRQALLIGALALASSAAFAAHHAYRVSIEDLTPVLANKVDEIVSECQHTKLISAYRPHARIAGTHHASLHSVYPARAADVKGDYLCIYAHLLGWPGGYSVDPYRVHHVHISYSPPGTGYLAGREWGARFKHYAGLHRRSIAGLIHRRSRLAVSGFWHF